MIYLRQNQTAMIAFVLVDANCVEVAGLGNTFTLQLSKAGAAFAGSAGVKGEIGFGWYYYTCTAAECNTVGPLAIRAWGAGTVQQNMLYFVRSATAGCVEFTYTVTDSGTGLPIQGVEVDISVDIAGALVVWCGVTDTFGVARDNDTLLPCLDPGTYFFWRQKPGYSFTDPDVEVVS